MGFFNKKNLYIMECIQRTLKKKEKKNTKPIFFLMYPNFCTSHEKNKH